MSQQNSSSEITRLKNHRDKYAAKCDQLKEELRVLKEKASNLAEIIKKYEEDLGYGYNDGCGCCSNNSLADDPDWKTILAAADQLKSNSITE